MTWMIIIAIFIYWMIKENKPSDEIFTSDYEWFFLNYFPEMNIYYINGSEWIKYYPDHYVINGKSSSYITKKNIESLSWKKTIFSFDNFKINTI